jgi:hypothetical protein
MDWATQIPLEMINCMFVHETVSPDGQSRINVNFVIKLLHGYLHWKVMSIHTPDKTQNIVKFVTVNFFQFTSWKSTWKYTQGRVYLGAQHVERNIFQVINCFLHFTHEKGLLLRCMSMCPFKCALRLKALPHSSQI